MMTQASDSPYCSKNGWCLMCALVFLVASAISKAQPSPKCDGFVLSLGESEFLFLDITGTRTGATLGYAVLGCVCLMLADSAYGSVQTLLEKYISHRYTVFEEAFWPVERLKPAVKGQYRCPASIGCLLSALTWFGYVGYIKGYLMICILFSLFFSYCLWYLLVNGPENFFKQSPGSPYDPISSHNQ